ncbi:MAG: ComF family protein [Spirochaetaceae bacterium]|jgi:ComF family protein|nr:ComF family protein [Spirochaetaceae bacterium]
MYKETLSLTREFFFPSACPVCGKPLVTGREARLGICADCEELFALEGGDRCQMCGRPLVSEIAVCTSCRAVEHVFDKVAVLYPYTRQWMKLLRAYKFHGHRALAHFFANKVLEARDLFFDRALFGELVLVPVPPRDGKIKKTGWDQVETIARILEQRTRLCRCLKRLPSATQKKLNAEDRAKNLKGRIVCTKSPPRHVLLVDDVYTTGATLEVCASALKESGAEKVYGLCLFRA